MLDFSGMQFNVDIASSAEVCLPPPVLEAGDFPVHERSSRAAWGVVLTEWDGLPPRLSSGPVDDDDRSNRSRRIPSDRTLLAQTRSRLASVVQDDRMLFVIAKSQEACFREELGGVHPSRLIVQPKNKGTGTAIAAAVLRIASADPNAVIAFTPSSHFYRNERCFHASLNAAISTAAEWQESVVLLGAQATHAAAGYDWIEPGAAASGDWTASLHRVQRVWQKPAVEVAESLHARACLWNTFVMAGHTDAFLRLLEACVPGLLDALIAARYRGRPEDAWLDDSLQPVDFSSQVLVPSAGELFVVGMPSSAGWSDLCAQERHADALWEGVAAVA
ncbi:MAG TPA: sugar phosphate nucleotidyltransferase [Bryobacteraceae bacterium]|nr:sugar phosphate nucleotidyltransferase [Bryobacteraceae bacterium]